MPRANPNPLEKDIEKKVCDHAKKLGCLVYKFTSPSRRSVPDRLFVMPDAKGVFFIEFKRRGEKPTAGQAVEINKILKNGTLVFLIDSVDSGCSLVNAMLYHSRTIGLPNVPEIVDGLGFSLVGALLKLEQLEGPTKHPAKSRTLTELETRLLVECTYWRARSAGVSLFEDLPPVVRAVLTDARIPGVSTDQEGNEIIRELKLRMLFNTPPLAEEVKGKSHDVLNGECIRCTGRVLTMEDF